MPTDKPRIAVTLSPAVYETISRFADLQGRSKGSVVAELLESIHPPLMRTVALLEAAADAPKQVRDGFRQTLEDIERQLVGTAGSGIAQMDWLISEVQQASAGRAEAAASPRRRPASPPKSPPNPHVVTRGSGHKNSPPSGSRKPPSTPSSSGVSAKKRGVR